MWFALGLVISALWTLGCRSFTPFITAQSSTDRIAANSPTSSHHSSALPPAEPAAPIVPETSERVIQLASFANQEPQSTTFRVSAADPLVIDPSMNIRPQATASGVASPSQASPSSSPSTQPAITSQTSAATQGPEIIQTPEASGTTAAEPNRTGIAAGAASPLDGEPALAERELAEVEPLTLDDVIVSVRVAFPAIRQALARQQEFAGRVTTAWGDFDDQLEGESINRPLGYYENYRHALGLKKPLITGGSLSGGYRLGDGFFEPWYGERETDEGGEFKLGVDLPLLQGRAIDKRRAALRAAQLESARTRPELSLELLSAQAAAAVAYWDWVAAGLNVRIQQRLLDLGVERADQIERRIRAGDEAEFTRIDNERLIASRQIKLIESQRKFGQSAVTLSLYLRDLQGQPSLPAADLLSGDYPAVSPANIEPTSIIAAAIEQRPEVQVLAYDASVLRVQLAEAENQYLPELNVVLQGAQDVGGKTSSKGDKSEGELETGIYGSVPLQRRAARGKIASTRAKLRQVEAKLQWTQDKIATEIQKIMVARQAALEQIEQAEKNVALAQESLRFGRIALDEGEITLPVLNIYEQALADAEAALVIAKGEYFITLALLQIARGIPLDEPTP